MVPQVISALITILFLSEAARAHDIYTHLKSRSGKSCCDNSDCRPAPYRITSSGVEMLVGETWVWVPRGIIEYRMLEGDTGRPTAATGAESGTKAASSRTARFYPRRLLPRPNRAVPAPVASTWSPRSAPARAAPPTRHAQRCNGNRDSEVQTGSARLRPAARPHSA